MADLAPCLLCAAPVAQRANGTVKMHLIPPERRPAHLEWWRPAWCEGGNPARSGGLHYPTPIV